jgi:predicted pyridoxine 5'-phosphate oxidase superfamily flavin-nucleotide-binding protein
MSARSGPGSWITSPTQIETIIGRPSPMVLMKQLDHLDEGSSRVLACAPLAGFGFRDAEANRPRTTFVGGRPGFVRVEAPGRISLAPPGGGHHPAEGSGVSFVFLLPGAGETLRLNGSVELSGAELRVAVEEVYVHCARCILRSGLWRGAEGPVPLPDAAASPDGGDGATVLLDPRIAGFLAASPFLVVSTWGSQDRSDTSPRGDQPGFARILDGRTLVIPDRRGNKRADTFRNLLADDRISLAAVIPGRTDVLHLSGTAAATADPALLSGLALKGVAPQAALVVDVESAEMVDNEALSQSALWRRPSHADHDAVPDLMVLASTHMVAPNVAPSAARSRPGAAKGLLLKLLAASPRLTRLMVELGYRIQLTKEGYMYRPRRRRGGGARVPGHRPRSAGGSRDPEQRSP